MKNNIFEYATGELSQDAFICWCINWFNDDSKPKLKEMSVELIKKFIETGEEKSVEIKSVDVYRQFSRNVYIDGEKKAVKIDVLIIVNETIAVIVEDKTFTSEHDDQIETYRLGFDDLVSNANENEKFYKIEKIKTVFLKTGFMYDKDKSVEADKVISGKEFLTILSKYVGNSEILDSYIANLERILQRDDNFGNYEGNEKDSFWNWNIAKYDIAQYQLMRDIFPETLWNPKNRDGEYGIYHGTSQGRPWTEMKIYERSYANSTDSFSIFWRIDTDSNGPYISLRLFEAFDKKNVAQKERHKNLYQAMSNTLESIIKKEFRSYEWSKDKNDENNVYPGYRGNYKESSLIHIKLKHKLLNWSTEKEKFVKDIREITEVFKEKLEEVLKQMT